MPIPWILLRYIFREMGKSFLLTAASLTGLLGLGGGLIEMIDLGEITPAQLLRLMLLMLPVAAALTLPMAALFSAASVYGRLSADNEFVACRSSGINLHVLFIPAIALSLLSAGVTFTFTSFVIPGMVRNLERFLSGDIGALVKQRLDRPRGITLGGKYRITADEIAVNVGPDNDVVLGGVAFVEIDGEDWSRYGTAREVRLSFHREVSEADGPKLQVSGRMLDLSFYDRKDKRFYEEAVRILAQNTVPQHVPLKLKFLTLSELLHYRRYPGTWREVRQQMDRLRTALGKKQLFDTLWDDWRTDRRLKIHDEDSEITVSSQTAARLPGAAGIELYEATIEDAGKAAIRRASAQRVGLEVVRGDTLADSGIIVSAYDVQLSDGDATVRRNKETFGPVLVPSEVVDRVAAMSTEALLAAGSRFEDPRLKDRYEAARAARGETARRIVATINERLAFSVSVVVLVILGAALGIIFRGSHVMVAFGISFAPSLLIIITIVMGKQMTYNAPTFALGLMVLWGGIALVAALDAWTLTRALRR